MTEIDYEALAKAGFDGVYATELAADHWDTHRVTRDVFTSTARAVVAALADQGLVVVRTEVLRGLVEAAGVPRPVFPPYLAEARSTLGDQGDGMIGAG
jgi:hypothetical protein